MIASILYNIPLPVIAFSIFILILIFHLIGAGIGSYQSKRNSDAKSEGLGPLEGALLGLLSLLLSFTFGMSASRFDARRSTIVKEANAIGTTILRADLYPDSIRTVFRKDLQQYVEARIDYYEIGTDEKKISQVIAQAEAISMIIWKRATALSQDPANTSRSYHMIPAINDMIDAATNRDSSRKARVPYSILWLLILLSLFGSFIIGYSKKQKKNDWIILTIYAVMNVITIYTIMDLDQSRSGIIKTNAAQERIVELRNLFKQP